MKYFIILCCSFSLLITTYAQTGKSPLPSCSEMADKFSVIRSQFDTFLDDYKNTQTRTSQYVTEYSANFDLCGAATKLEEWKLTNKFVFRFTDSYFSGSNEDYIAFFEKVYNIVKRVFAGTHAPSYSAENPNEYRHYFFYEDGNAIMSKRNITVQLSLKYSLAVNVTFEYWKK